MEVLEIPAAYGRLEDEPNFFIININGTVQFSKHFKEFPEILNFFLAEAEEYLWDGVAGEC